MCLIHNTMHITKNFRGQHLIFVTILKAIKEIKSNGCFKYNVVAY